MTTSTETKAPEAKADAGGNKRPPRGKATVIATPDPRKRPVSVGTPRPRKITGRAALRVGEVDGKEF